MESPESQLRKPTKVDPAIRAGIVGSGKRRTRDEGITIDQPPVREKPKVRLSVAEPDRLFTHRLSRAERQSAGKKLRDACPREAHAVWKAPTGRPDPVSLVVEADKGRIPELLPLRHGRMALSPFTFYRGSALNMAVDLATTPATGVRVQCCGDAHLGNFRGLGTPERRIIFAINDLDETLPAPWEWDVKRLAASFVVACRNNGLSESTARDAVLTCVRSYREQMRTFSEMNPLDLWYCTVDSETLLAAVDDPEFRKRASKRVEKERTRRVEEDLFPTFKQAPGATPVIEDRLPTIFHWKGQRPGEIHSTVAKTVALYRESLAPATRALLDRYDLRDAAIKVVGVGSVGTSCWVALFTDGDGNSLVLQGKEARASVLEAHAGKSVYRNHGQRVVNGQRLMQPVSDIFLGWTEGRLGRQGYVRQLRDIKIRFAVETFGKPEMLLDAKWSGHTLALSHARSGDPALISGYLGKSDAFDEAIGAFSVAYANQNDKDYAALKRAIKSGKLKAVIEGPK
jgi:uncharacterized protein (DUF2252 family)